MINAGARRIIKSAAVAGGAAVIGSSAAEAKEAGIDFSQQPDKHRIIFAPKNTHEESTLSLNRKQLSQIALWEVKDAPKDVLTEMVLSLGEDLAKDPSVQNAVYKKFGISMNSSIMDREMDADTDTEDKEITQDHLEEQLNYLKDELESQQTLNDQLIYHNDRLAEEKIKLKKLIGCRDNELRKIEREKRLLADKVKMMGGDVKEVLGSDNEAVEEGADNKEDDSSNWDMSQIVVKALAVAAVVILMAVVKRKGAVTVAATSAVGAWSWMRARMKV